MNCERFLTYVDSLEPAETAVPKAMAEHACRCPSCAKALESARRSLSLLRAPCARAGTDLSKRVSALLPFAPAPRRSVPMRDWVLAGFLLISGMALLPLMADFKALKTVYGTGFTLPMAIVLGLVVSTYAVVFVFSHAAELAKRLRLGQLRKAGQLR